MTTLLLAFPLMLILVAAMAVGVMFGRRPISGSCGGLSAAGVSAECDICGGNPARCDAAGDAADSEAARLADNAARPAGRSAD